MCIKDEQKQNLENKLECPLGGDETNDCEDCIYSPEYHYENGECVRRDKMNPDNPKPCPFQDNCVNFTQAKNGNCACEFDDVLDCFVDKNCQTCKYEECSFQCINSKDKKEE